MKGSCILITENGLGPKGSKPTTTIAHRGAGRRRICGSLDTKNYILTHKIAEWSDKTKTDKIVLKEKFDTIEEVLDFMIDHYGDVLKEDYKYFREGWEYHLEKGDIFIECLETLGPTMEIEADNKSDLENLFKLFEVKERFSESTSEIMRKLQRHSN